MRVPGPSGLGRGVFAACLFLLLVLLLSLLGPGPAPDRAAPARDLDANAVPPVAPGVGADALPLPLHIPIDRSCLLLTMDAASGVPLAGVDVFDLSERPSVPLATTGADGSCRLPVLTHDRWLASRREGYCYREQFLTAGQRVAVVYLLPGRGLSGRVVDETGVRPVREAIVAVRDAATAARLDSPRHVLEDGSFRTAALPIDRPVSLHVVADGYVPTRTTVVIERDNDIVITLGRGAEVSGLVVGTNGAPVPGAAIHLIDNHRPRTPEELAATALLIGRWAATAATDSSGRFAIRGLQLGRYVILAVAPDAAMALGQPFALTAAGERSEQVLLLSEPTGVSVSIRPDQVAADTTLVIARLDRDGAALGSAKRPCKGGASVVPLMPGTYRIAVVSYDCAPLTSDVTVEAGEIAPIVATLQRGAEAAGRVTDEADMPIEGLDVSVATDGVVRVARTDEGGSFVLRGLKFADGVVVIRDPRRRYEGVTMRMVRDAGIMSVRLRLAPRLLGRVIPIPQDHAMECRLVIGDEVQHHDLYVEDDGAFALWGVPTGVMLRLVLVAERQGVCVRDVAPVETGEAMSIGPCVLQVGRTIVGVVRDAKGNPCPWIPLLLSNASYQIDRSGLTNAAGEFRFVSWPDGESELSVFIRDGVGEDFDVSEWPSNEPQEVRLHVSR